MNNDNANTQPFTTQFEKHSITSIFEPLVGLWGSFQLPVAT